MPNHLLSILIPAYNEKATIKRLVEKVRGVSLPISREIIAVDDGSKDGTGSVLESLKGTDLTVLYHEKNRGKGAAIRTALAKATGDIILIQDADLEYNPKDYLALLEPILDGRADVVYGSRFLGGPHRVLLFWHYMGNLLFTFCIGASAIRYGHLIDPGMPLADFCGDFGLKAETIASKLKAFKDIRFKYLVADPHVGEIDVVEKVRHEGKK